MTLGWVGHLTCIMVSVRVHTADVGVGVGGGGMSVRFIGTMALVRLCGEYDRGLFYRSYCPPAASDTDKGPQT